MRRKRIVVLYGGRADEHPISCVSAAGVLGAMDTDRFEPVPIGITKEGQWVVSPVDPRTYSLGGASQDSAAGSTSMPEVIASGARSVVLDTGKGSEGFFIREQDGSLSSLGHVDAVFPVLHGPYGEDGTVQGLLEMMGVPYVGCGVFASAACMDKHFTKTLLQAAGIPVVPGITVDVRGFDADDGFGRDARKVLDSIHAAHLRYPLFVKPSRAGSSFGVSKLEREDDERELAAALFEASQHDWRILIENGVDAREIECAVLAPVKGGEPRAALPGEIVLDRRSDGDDQFYDFDSKYTDSEASHVQVPADLPQSVLDEVRRIAIRAFKAVDGAGLSRVDTFVGANGDVVVNEINTMPGFTPISMYPKAFEATGLSYTGLITELLDAVMV